MLKYFQEGNSRCIKVLHFPLSRLIGQSFYIDRICSIAATEIDKCCGNGNTEQIYSLSYHVLSTGLRNKPRLSQIYKVVLFLWYHMFYHENVCISRIRCVFGNGLDMSLYSLGGRLAPCHPTLAESFACLIDVFYRQLINRHIMFYIFNVCFICLIPFSSAPFSFNRPITPDWYYLSTVLGLKINMSFSYVDISMSRAIYVIWKSMLL